MTCTGSKLRRAETREKASHYNVFQRNKPVMQSSKFQHVNNNCFPQIGTRGRFVPQCGSSNSSKYQSLHKTSQGTSVQFYFTPPPVPVKQQATKLHQKMSCFFVNVAKTLDHFRVRAPYARFGYNRVSSDGSDSAETGVYFQHKFPNVQKRHASCKMSFFLSRLCSHDSSTRICYHVDSQTHATSASVELMQLFRHLRKWFTAKATHSFIETHTHTRACRLPIISTHMLVTGAEANPLWSNRTPNVHSVRVCVVLPSLLC